MPSVGIDATGNIFMSYCPLIEGTDSGNLSPLAFSYRNVYLTASTDNGATWSAGLNISDSQFDEAVFCSMAKEVDACVSLLWQQDGSPGYSVPPNGEHAIGNNDYVYACADKTLVLSSINEVLIDGVSVSVFPNPASSNIVISYTVDKQIDLVVEIRNIMGQVVANFNKKADAKGVHSMNVNIEKYSSGVYTVNTIMGDKVFSTKFVKN
ncbi:MAG: T9SS type A sorting domain-containing protein [Bacteroidetes bacterium]|nr:T9SS type A sorting domain-containing protein [Bacteroidota bacterium]